jgi:hypothetical protein
VVIDFNRSTTDDGRLIETKGRLAPPTTSRSASDWHALAGA